MKLVVSKYPKIKLKKHSGDSHMEHQVGKRTLDYGDLDESFEEHLNEHGDGDEPLEMVGKYPERKMMKHSGDSTIIYEGGKRVTDIDEIPEAFEDIVEETEGGYLDFEVNVRDSGAKKVPKTKGTFPTEFGSEKLGFDTNVLAGSGVNIETFRPTVKEIFSTLRLIRDQKVKEQIFAMLFNSEVWISEICDGLAEYKEEAP